MSMCSNGIGGGGIVNQGSLTRVLSLLGGPVRLEIIRYLALGPRPVGQLAEETGQSIGLVSHNLRLLREANLVACTPRSRQRIYSLASSIRVRYGDQSLDLSVQAAAEGSLTLSVPAPALSPAEPAPATIQVNPGLTEQLDQSGALEAPDRLAKGA
ncbi:MAG: metalloregulator ArsR/SmtB family transcription factor [Phycisphaerales bacterium]|nr:metalloregulator ArsR/SmtB family transcription factor [Phycisphaerales bacterium]